ncbi:hypothetical protein DH2020_003565 [Rehmannia glutinosa]|uniref:Xyloglucan endotransglucosylase/hydrolase n=1 Tax=Rehmannia glutinosa TaxID=99300 RepID=A0ABR0XLY5_REHGL
MAVFHHNFLLTSLLIFLRNIIVVYSRGPVYTPPNVDRLTDRFSRLSVNQSYNVFFGGANVHVTNNGTSADLSLDKSSGSGLVSKNKYYYGFFNAAIKLPAGFTSGVVVAYYPMSVYATIWDASQWATHGGKYPVNYKFAPFVTSMTGIEMEGCIVNSKNMAPSCSKSSLSSIDPVDGEQFSKLSSQQISGLEWARRKHMFYSYCQDKPRYKVLPQECSAK